MEALIPIVAIVMTFGVPMLFIWSKHRKDMMRMQIEATAEKAAQYASHVEQLEARVRVLERIATDKGADLAQQIESLRDETAPVLAAPEKELN